VALVLLALTRPGGRSRAAALAWLVLLAAVAAAIGAGLGTARLAAIDAGALRLGDGEPVLARGYLTAVPDRYDGLVALRLQTPAGRLLVEAREPVAPLDVGTLVAARGRVRAAREWEAARLRRLGIATVLAARAVRPLGARRGGLAGTLDGVRLRAEDALGRGTSEQAASLLRGFVLGQDDLIAPATVAQFKRAGLSHLLAVSGQNVVLLSALAAVVLAALGVSLRARLAWILVAIAVYVPVAGAGASIQRAGVMGAAGVVAVLAGRPRSRWYALLLAAAATLALDPRASADVGWQLSFAAVIGILAGAGPISGLFGRERSGWRRALADAAGLTVAATIATAPLVAHHFGVVSLVALPANLVAAPAVAPVMWLGMLAAAVGQLPWLPVEALTWPAGMLAAYVGQVSEWFGAPAWAQADLALGAPGPLLGAYAALALATTVAVRWAARRRAMEPGAGRGGGRGRRARGRWVVLAAAALALAGWAAIGSGEGGSPAGLRLTVLDVGQGDSILLEPRGCDPILVDTGPAAARVVDLLAERGIDRLSALAITHPEADHDGGTAELLARVEVGRLVYARAGRRTLDLARARGTAVARVAEGASLRCGSLRLEVLWPPAARLVAGPAGRPDDANLLSLVLLARWHAFRALLSGDAEAEAAPVAPGGVDLLKVAHHGSEDAGLAALLERARPRLAVISAGAGNPYGHPSPQALSVLAAAGVEVLRTDLAGEVEVAVSRRRWRVSG